MQITDIRRGVQAARVRHLVENRLGHALLVEQVVVVPGDLVTLLQNGVLQAPQAIHRLDLGRENHLVIGFRQKVVTADLQTTGQCLAFGQGREEDDRHQGFPGQGLDLPGRLEAVHDRHHRIHQHQVRMLLAKRVDRFGAVGRRQHVVPLAAQDARQQQAIGGAVLGNQDRQRLQWLHGNQLMSNSLSKLEMARILRTSVLLLTTRTSESSPPA
ncbi:hypothetical protein D9M71_188940 [compost metagenome]